MVLYDILSQVASKLPQLGDLDFPLYLIKVDFLGIFNLEFLVVLIPLGVEYHKVPHLKALTRSIEHRSGHGQASIFRWQK